MCLRVIDDKRSQSIHDRYDIEQHEKLGAIIFCHELLKRSRNYRQKYVIYCQELHLLGILR